MLNTEIQKKQLGLEIWDEWFMLIVNNIILSTFVKKYFSYKNSSSGEFK